VPFDQEISARVREALQGVNGVEEKKMFGGLAFMVRGNMCCGVVGDELMVRVGPEQYDSSLTLPGAREMDFTGKPLRGFVFVSQDALATSAALQAWVERGLSFVSTLPSK
jgi:TfoX/Sxy family transcriptional regulator of competence genes